MKLISFQKCEDCGKEFQDWACDFCYSNVVVKQVGGL